VTGQGEKLPEKLQAERHEGDVLPPELIPIMDHLP
jgi:hypothetical protein